MGYGAGLHHERGQRRQGRGGFSRVYCTQRQTSCTQEPVTPAEPNIQIGEGDQGMTSIQTSVCVVGGGPAGLLLGLLLAKRGVDVIVLEGHETFNREFRGEVLQPSTAHLLDELGLLQYVLRQPHSTLTEGLVRVNGKTAGEFAFSTIVPEYPYAIWIPQPIFLQAL